MLTYKQLSLFTTSLLLLILLLTGCSGSNNTAAGSTQAASDVFKVALLLPGKPDDQGWSQSGYEGLKLIEKELGAQVAYTPNVPESDSEKEKITRQYAQDGFDFIIGHGGEYLAAFEIVAKEFPKTQFGVLTSYAGNNQNLGAIGVRADEAGYLGGIVAGLKTKTNKVAYIGGEVYPSTTEEAKAFEKGVKAITPSVEVSIAWVESWSNRDKAKKVALAQIEAGADILAVDADVAGLAVLEVAESKGIKAIGWVQDQHDLAPKVILTSVIQRVSVALLESAILVREGRWEGKQYKFGLQEQVIDLAPFYGVLTPEEEAKVKAVREDILINKIDVSPQ